MDVLDRMLDHDRWTTTRVLDLSRTLTDEELDRPFDIGHQTLRATLVHMIFSVEIWNAGLTGRPPELTEDDHIAALIARHERSAAAFAAVARQMRDAGRLDETFVDPWLDEPTYRTFGTGIAHVILHDMQHRSEALHILKRLGVGDLPDGDPKEWEEATQPVQAALPRHAAGAD